MADLDMHPTTVQAQPKYEWPFCAPAPGVLSGCYVDDRVYRPEETAPGVWQWVLDQETMQMNRDHEKARRDLWWALGTRVLTDDEMDRVRNHGRFLNIPMNVNYNEHEKSKELNEALANQAKLRLMAGRA